MVQMHWFDRITAPFAPGWTLKRQRARLASDLLARHYDAASVGRRTQGWKKSHGDANAVIGPALHSLRASARDLTRNNPWAESALNTIVDNAVATGITGRPSKPNQRAADVWKRWSESTDCDADGQHDFLGLQKLIARTVVESGEVIVRRRLRLPGDDLYLNTQVQVLDPDFLDTSKDNLTLPNGGKIIQGKEFDPIGRCVAYWLFSEHPGALTTAGVASKRVPAESILHVFKGSRPGQVRAVTWFAPVLMRSRDFDEFEDATLMKQKIAACLSVITTDETGDAPALGTADDTKTPPQDMLEPGAILNAAPGRKVEVIQPPSTADYEPYSKTQLRAIAAGLGISYEELTGDFGQLSFSAARMSRIRIWPRIEDFRWRVLIPKVCTPIWIWVMEAAAILGEISAVPEAIWTCEPPPMIDPVNEGLAYQRRIRNGLVSWSEAQRELGYDPDVVLQEIEADNAKLDAAGIILDSDPRKVTQAGQLQGTAKGDGQPANEPTPVDGGGAQT